MEVVDLATTSLGLVATWYCIPHSKKARGIPVFILCYTILQYTLLYCTTQGGGGVPISCKMKDEAFPYDISTRLSSAKNGDGGSDNPMCNDSITVYPNITKMEWRWFPSQYTHIHIKIVCMLYMYNAALRYSTVVPVWDAMLCYSISILIRNRIFVPRLRLY